MMLQKMENVISNERLSETIMGIAYQIVAT